MKYSFYSLIFILALSLFTSCGAITDENPENTDADIIVENQSFSPDELTVDAGVTLTITNDDNETHSVTSDDNSFDEIILESGETGTILIPSDLISGDTLAFHCKFHTDMTGIIIIN